MSQSINGINLFGGTVRSLSVAFGFNSNPTVITTTVVAPKNQILSINSREIVDITVGAVNIRGIVQSWDAVKTDVAGTGIYQVRISDTKPVLDSTSIFIGSELNVSYGDNIIPVEPQIADDLEQGIDFDTIKSAIENSVLKYGSEKYTISLDFILPARGIDITYKLKPSSMSLLELITQVTNDHGVDWVLTTDSNNIIHVNTISRQVNTSLTLSSIKSLHSDEIIRLKEGKENRDSVLKVGLLGAYRTFLNKVNGSAWSQFWGMDQIGTFVLPRSRPLFSLTDMERIINKDYEDDEFTQQNIHEILNYANEFWGRKFITQITPTTVLDVNNESWLVPASAGWWEANHFPAILDEDGQLKFQNDDGRWVTFVQIPFAGTRIGQNANVTYQWDNSLFSNTNTYATQNRRLFVKAKVEIIGKYFILTLSTPLRLRKRVEEEDETTGIVTEVFKQTRHDKLTTVYLALTDQRNNYGPWFNRLGSVGKTELLIDNSLSPWSFGYRGITNKEGVEIMNKVARSKIKTIADSTLESDIFDLEVANVPKVNIGTQLNTGLITNINVKFGVDSVTTTYSSKQFTNELSRHQRYYQELVDRLRRQAALNNNRPEEPEQEFGTPETDLGDDGTDTLLNRDKQRLGRIDTRVDGNGPKYNLTPMAWVSDAFGELSLVRDPSVFGDYLRVVNMSEKQTAPGRLPIGTLAEVKIFSRTPGGVESYFMEVGASPPQEFNAVITGGGAGIGAINVGTVSEPIITFTQPIYSVDPVENEVQDINLLPTDRLNLVNGVINIGEPPNASGLLQPGEIVTIYWNEAQDGSFTPFIQRQINLFKLP